MADFPSLTPKPDAQGFAQGVASDPTLRSETESGQVLTRARFTAGKRKWTLQYTELSNTDKETLETFERTTVRYGAGSFNWTNPVNNTAYVVRFGKPIDFVLASSLTNSWDVSMELHEV